MKLVILWQLIALMTFLMISNDFRSVDALAFHTDTRHSSQPSRTSRDVAVTSGHSSEIALSRRAFKDIPALGVGWVGHIQYYDALYPLNIGVQILGKFYTTIMQCASTVWTWKRQMNTYMMSIGTIRLWIWSEDALARISWDFVRDFASRMLSATQLGFVGLFDASFVHMPSGVMVHVKLIVLGKMGLPPR